MKGCTLARVALFCRLTVDGLCLLVFSCSVGLVLWLCEKVMLMAFEWCPKERYEREAYGMCKEIGMTWKLVIFGGGYSVGYSKWIFTFSELDIQKWVLR